MTLFHQDIQINTAEKQKFFIQFYCKLRQQNKKKTHYKTAKQIKKHELRYQNLCHIL